MAAVHYDLVFWNARLGRAVPDVQEVMGSADAISLQEVNGAYSGMGPAARRRRRALAREGLKVVRSGNGEGAIVVRKAAKPRQHRMHTLSRIGWERGQGRPGLHPRRETTSIRIGKKGARIRVLNVHLPPKPDEWERRGRARRQSLQSIEAICRRWNVAMEAGRLQGWAANGDWNMTAKDPRIQALARRLGAQVKGSGIDFVLYRGVVVSGYTVLERRASSDHAPRRYRVTVKINRKA